MARADDPVKVQDYVWEAEYDRLADGTVTEQQLGELLTTARAKWPERWEFQAMSASHYVRVGDMEQARIYHEQARTLYMANPATKPGAGAGAAILLGGAVGALVHGAVVDPDVVEFPAAPSAETWSPPFGATYATAR
jgi:hypothetical protein